MAVEKQPVVAAQAAGRSLVTDIFSTAVVTVKEALGKVSGGKFIKLSEIQLVNAALCVLACVLAAYLVLSIDSSIKKLRVLNFKVIPAAGQPFQSPKLASRLKENSFYLEIVKLRNIFKMGPKSKATVDEIISSKAAEAAKDLRLVGISWSDDPDVMVENTKLFKTYFVRQGQMVGDFKVEKILKDKIVLRYGEELIELR